MVAIGTPLVTMLRTSMSNQSAPSDTPGMGSHTAPIVVWFAFSGCRSGLPPKVTVYCVLQSGLFSSLGSGHRNGSLSPAWERPGAAGL